MTERQPIQEQIAYYDARAGEYDEWFFRQGRYDRGPGLNRKWSEEIEQVRAPLRAWRPRGRVLELAAGTGLWSAELAAHADSLTLVDSSAKALAIAQRRLQPAQAELIEADLFDWRPPGRFDCVFFGFWLSHVPGEQFAAFWDVVRDCLAPGGRVFFIDSRPTPHSTASNHVLPKADATIATRRLSDGREFRVIKIFYDPTELSGMLRSLAWRAEISTTREYFLFGSAVPIPPRAAHGSGKADEPVTG